MPRKEEQAYITENSVFAKRLRELMAERGENQTTLAEKINMRRQTVSLYTTGQSEPLASKVAEIARALDVSADYLLGLREDKTTDITIQGVVDFTGLNENSVQNILDVLCRSLIAGVYIDNAASLNALLSSPALLGLISSISTLKRRIDGINNMNDPSQDEEEMSSEEYNEIALRIHQQQKEIKYAGYEVSDYMNTVLENELHRNEALNKLGTYAANCFKKSMKLQLGDANAEE